MRIRDFKWSTDVAVPAIMLLVSVWGIAGGSPQLAFVTGASFVIIGLYVLGRVERVQPDGSYRALVSQHWYTSRAITKLVMGVVLGSAVGSVNFLLLGLSPLLAISVAVGLALAAGLLVALLGRIRRRQ